MRATTRSPKPAKLNWAVFDLKTGLRLTEYASRCSAGLRLKSILRDQPDAAANLGIRQRDYEQSR